MPFKTAQVNVPACSVHCPLNAERQTGKLLITIVGWPDLEWSQSPELQRRTPLPLCHLSCWSATTRHNSTKSVINSPEICPKSLATISRSTTPFKTHDLNSNKLWRLNVDTWGLLHLSPPSSTHSSNLIHLKWSNFCYYTDMDLKISTKSNLQYTYSTSVAAPKRVMKARSISAA